MDSTKNHEPNVPTANLLQEPQTSPGNLLEVETIIQSLNFPNLEFQGVLEIFPAIRWLRRPSVRSSSLSLAALPATAGGADSERLDIERERLYSIRIPQSPVHVNCAACRLRFLAAGPTGFIEDEPICDECLLLASEGLGMLLALSALTRSFGTLKGASRDEYSEALAELAAFARIYESIAARSGPLRSFKISDTEN